MFERFTDRARLVLVVAQEEARRLHHHYIGTEHLLLGLVGEGEGTAAQLLVSLGISLEGVRAQVEAIVGRGRKAPSGHLPFTKRAKKVLDLSLREALLLGRNDLGTEHILLGIIREGNGRAAQVLMTLGADFEQIRKLVTDRGSAGAAGGDPSVRGRGPTLGDSSLRCVFCGLDKTGGVSGGTRDMFICDDCITRMVNLRRIDLGDDD